MVVCKPLIAAWSKLAAALERLTFKGSRMFTKLAVLAGSLILFFPAGAVEAASGADGGGFAMQAYIDPGTGSFLIQMLIAGIVGAGFVIRMFWESIKVYLSKVLRKSKKTNGDDN